MNDPEASLQHLVDGSRALLSQIEVAVEIYKKELVAAAGVADSRKITYMVYAVEPDNRCPGHFVPGLEVQGQSELARQLGVTQTAIHLSRRNALIKWEGLKDTEKWPEDRGKFTVRGVTLMTIDDYYRALSSGLKAVHGLE